MEMAGPLIRGMQPGAKQASIYVNQKGGIGKPMPPFWALCAAVVRDLYGNRYLIFMNLIDSIYERKN